VQLQENVAAQATNYEFEREVFDLTNEHRIANGLNPLQWDDVLATASREHSEDMFYSNNMSHTGSDGSTPGQRIDRMGIAWRRWAENVAAGQQTPAEVVEGWMNSPGHRANILNPNLTTLGVGFYNYYWTQKFVALS